MTQLLEDVSAITAPVQMFISENDSLLPLAQTGGHRADPISLLGAVEQVGLLQRIGVEVVERVG